MSYNNIPEELKSLNQWIVWKYEDIGAAKPTKVPYSPQTGHRAAVDDPTTWASFEVACKASANFSGIGFVFTEHDPYCFIDLDDTNGDALALDRQVKIFKEFDSYSEVSPSGKGLHIIVKGFIPAGRRRTFIEVYSSHRYATFTGNVHLNKPIAERQSLLTQLWEQMGSGVPATFLYDGTDKEVLTDAQVIEQALNASNGDKFKTLHEGRWQDIYPSQSEADFAYVDIIAFYTQNKTQITRIFHASQLGQRLKAKRKDYINYMLSRVFDRMLPKIDFDGFANAIENKQLELKLAGSSNGKTTDFESVNASSTLAPVATSIPLPPGLMGELAQFIYQAAPRPVPEIALAAAIGLMAGICGRAYNVSGTGLNQYILLLAATGSGKEAMALGIDRLMNTIKIQVPTSSAFMGPSEIASGQALVKYLSKNSQCFVSILGEFGIRLEAMSSPHANSAEKALKRTLLDLYNKSGHGQAFRSSIFADADKNISTTESPSFTILGESTPERFYSALNEDMISEGLLPRFMLIEYNGIRPTLNDNHLQAIPSFQLVDRLAGLVANVETIMHSKRVINIEASPDADRLMRDFDKFSDKQINNTNKDVIRQLWNRAHIKVLKLSGLIAVGVNMSNPTILIDYVQWSINMVQSDIKALSAKFEAGEIGTNSDEIRQSNEIKRMIKEYLNKDWEHISKYSKEAKMHHEKVIPYVYLNKRLAPVSVFRRDKIGGTNALKRAIQVLIDTDYIREASKQELIAKFGTSQRCFIVSNTELLN